MGKDGIECPAFCPSTCGPEEMSCWGGEDMNMCQMPDFCVPSKGNIPLYTYWENQDFWQLEEKQH